MSNFRYYTQWMKPVRKIAFYVRGFCTYYVPKAYYRARYASLTNRLSENERKAVDARAAYYNRMLSTPPDLHNLTSVQDFKYPHGKKKKFSTYFFDLYGSLKYFPEHYRFSYLFGDVTEEPEMPAFVKSRPIPAEGAHSNSVILKLNKARHYLFIKDSLSFREKKDMIVSRNCVRQPHRKRWLEMYHGHPMCNVGQINPDVQDGHQEWLKEYMTIPQQLKYKFICCLEGNDVATNLKWVMSSNSLAVMPRPKYETWFMEGSLIPGYHYVEIKEDYSDLIEKMEYYIARPDEAETIIRHAHEYIRQFKDRRMEKLVSLAVVEKYFRLTGQME